jgi:hypothetical protein
VAIPQVDRNKVLAAMERFDRELRNTPEWSAWASNGNYEHAILHDDKSYPVKQIIRMATGYTDFSGGPEANSYILARGFQVAPLNRIQQGLEAVLSGYSVAKAGAFGGSNEMRQVFKTLAAALARIPEVATRKELRVTLGLGQGQWARVPWVAILDSRETDSTQRGVYCVFLFRQDMSGVYLTFNQGVTQPDESGSGNRRQILAEKAKRLRGGCGELRAEGFVLDERIDLRVEGGIGADYEVSTIAYKLYEAGKVPPDAAIRSDVGHVLEAYRRYVEKAPLSAEPKVDATPMVKLDPDAMELYKQTFLRRMPGFKDFVDSGVPYKKAERDYKDELVALFQRSFGRELFEGGSLEVGGRVIRQLSDLLTKPLSQNGDTQNLVSWRYTGFLRTLTPDQKAAFALRLKELLYGEGPSGQRVERFNLAFQGLLRSISEESPVPATRTFPTLLLMLAHPEKEFIVRSDLTSRVTRALVDRDLLLPGPLDNAQYTEVVKFALTVKEKLAEWGWRPRDMIDVQTFLWVASVGKYGPDEHKGDNGGPDGTNVKFETIHTVFAEALQEANLDFGSSHEEVTRSFLASLATKRFVILTGLSGSGKTQIALKFGEWLGPDNHLLVPVRPDWTGAEALFGYQDALAPILEERPAWHVDRALKFMIRAARNPGAPFALILDEMNLAHVERYFADALSGIESGEEMLPNLTKENDGYWRIPKGEQSHLAFPKNLFVIGTVNVDETTYLFSPKVLDRANTFEFRVRTEDLTEEAKKPSVCAPGDPRMGAALLQMSQDDTWQVNHPHPELTDFTARLRDLHRILARAGFEFGHRVFYEAIRFAAMLNAAGESSFLKALDLQVLQKVLPRLHGSRRKLEATLIDVSHFCYDLTIATSRSESTETFDPTATTPSTPQLPRSFEKLRRMTEAVRANQFTSFTE